MNEIVSEMLSRYRITSPYGSRIDPITGKTEYHSGVDLVVGHMQPIYAFVTGKVVHAKLGVLGSGYGGYGNVVAVKDNLNNYHLYAHLDTIEVQVGDQVEARQLIGKQGQTGRVTGSHLHYEVRNQGKLLEHTEPINYLNEYYNQETIQKIKIAQVGNVNIVIGDNKFQGIIIDGVSYAPVRIMANAIGKKVTWDGKTKTVEFK